MEDSFKNLYLDEDEAGTSGGAAASAFGGVAAGTSGGAVADLRVESVVCNCNLYLFSMRLETFEHI